MDRWDYAGVAIIVFLLGMHGLALYDRTTIDDALSLQAGILAMESKR